MLIKEEKYSYVIKIKRLICVDNVITVGTHTLSSNPACFASPGSVNLTTLIVSVEGRDGNALCAVVPELLIMPLSCIWPSSMAHIPWVSYSPPDSSSESTEAPVPLCTTSETFLLLLGNFQQENKISSKLFRLFPLEFPVQKLAKWKVLQFSYRSPSALWEIGLPKWVWLLKGQLIT